MLRPVTPEVAGSSPVAPAQKVAAHGDFFVAVTQPAQQAGNRAGQPHARAFAALAGVFGRRSHAPLRSPRPSADQSRARRATRLALVAPAPVAEPRAECGPQTSGSSPKSVSRGGTRMRSPCG